MPNENDRPRRPDDDDEDDRPRRRERDRDDRGEDRPRRRDREEDYDEERPRRRRDERDDDDYDDRPRRREPQAAGNGMAVAALILGLLSFCTGPLTGIPAGICGLVGMGKPTGRGLAIAGLVLGLLGTITGVVGGYFAYTRVESAKERMRDSNNLKQVALGFHSQQDANWNGMSGPYAPDNTGKPNTGLSWRVGLLPYVEQGSLYNRYDRSEAWDSPKNKSLSNTAISTYTSPYDEVRASANTPYRVFYGGGALFEEDGKPVNLSTIPDGTSNTILAVHAAEQVPWAAPRDLKYDPKGPLPKLGHPSQSGTFTVAMADGSVRLVSTKVSERTLRRAITKADGEPLDFDW